MTNNWAEVRMVSDIDKARDGIALLKLNASLPCVSCESLLAEVNELKLTHCWRSLSIHFIPYLTLIIA